MNENNSYTTELIRIETRKIPTSRPLTKEDEILMENYIEIYRIALIRSAMGGTKGIHSYNTKSGRIWPLKSELTDYLR